MSRDFVFLEADLDTWYKAVVATASGVVLEDEVECSGEATEVDFLSVD